MIQRQSVAAAVVLAGIAALVAGALLALANVAALPGSGLSEVSAGLGDSSIWAAVRFTALEAGLSTVLSTGLAVPVARALARRSGWPVHALVIRLLTVPLALPALVAVFGILTVWGRAGWLAHATGLTPPIYGLGGILLAHVFFNMPFATLLLTARLKAIPAETWRLASQLGFGRREVFALIEWPALRAGLAGVATIIFLICVTSFTIVLTLGGGPWATTLEVAIYQSLRFDYDPPRAVILALLQMMLCLAVMAALQTLGAPMLPMAGLDQGAIGEPAVGRAGLADRRGAIADAVVIGAAVVFTAAPLLAVALAALAGLPALWADRALVLAAAGTSLCVAAAASLLSVAAAWSLVVAGRTDDRFGRLARLLAGGGAVLLVVPPFVLGAGWFLLLNDFGLAFALAPLVMVTLNALMSLPFALRILAGAEDSASRDVNRLCATLGLDGWTRLRLIDWQRLRPAFAFAGALCAALSLGDLGIAALFGSERLQTLPLLLQTRMGSYRQTDAASLAGLLALLCLAIFIAGGWIAKSKARPS